MNQLDRRSFMQRTGLAGLSLVAAGIGVNRAVADPEPPAQKKEQSTTTTSSLEPHVYGFQVGDTEAFVVQDGTFVFAGIQPSFAPEGTPAGIEALCKREFVPADHLALSLNVLVLKAKSGVTMFDAGAGGAFGPVAGNLMRGLGRIGVKPDEIKTIFVTHAHPDHVGGLLDADAKPLFPAARIIAAKSEVEFWTSETPDLSGMRTPPEAKAQSASMIRKILTGVKPQLELKEPGRLTEEVELIAAPGHTPGHSLFRVTQGDEKLLVIGDAVHAYALQFAQPDWTMIYDVNPALAAQTRRKLFKELAAERTLAAAFHLPFPGVGHVRAIGSAFEWVPRPWTY